MRKRIHGSWCAAGACLLALAGCNSDQNVNVGTTAVHGSVGGIVLDAGNGLTPIMTAHVTVVAGGATKRADTDDQGVFTVQDVPAGSVVIHIVADKHLDVYLSRTLNESAGNFPLSNPSLTVGPIGLLPNTGTFKVRLVDQSGTPANMVRVTARTVTSYIDLSGGGVNQAGVFEANTTSDATGLATFANFPDFNAAGAIVNDTVVVAVPPTMIAGATESYDFLGLQQTFQATRLSSQTPTIVLAGPRSPFQVLSSNIDFLVTGGNFSTASLIKAAGPINVVFNQAVSKDSVRAIIYTADGTLAMVQPTPAVTANVVSLGFGGKMLDPSQRYNLELHVSSSTNQTKEYNSLAPFFTPSDFSGNVAVANLRLDANNMNDTIITFSEPIGAGNGNAQIVPCVVFYEADLDGNSQLTSCGEWNPNGNASLKCCPGDPRSGLYLRPDEQTFSGAQQSTAITGFTTRWRLTVKPFAQVCQGNYQCCVGGATVHLQFSRNPDGNFVIRRTNGAPVPDLTLQLPGFQC